MSGADETGLHIAAAAAEVQQLPPAPPPPAVGTEQGSILAPAQPEDPCWDDDISLEMRSMSRLLPEEYGRQEMTPAVANGRLRRWRRRCHLPKS